MKSESYIGLLIILATAVYWIYRIREYFRPRSLWEASRDGDLRRIRRLLDEGVSPDDRTGSVGSYTPLMAAIEQHRQEAALLLLERGADPVAVSPDGYSPIYLAVEADDTVLAEELIRRGASPTWRRPMPDWAPIHVAAGEGNAEMISLLVRAGAEPNEPDDEGETPLLIALRSGYPDAARKLLDLGADPAARNGAGQTVLHAITMLADPGCVELALSLPGVDTNEADRDGRTALALACDKEGYTDADTIRRLLDAGCDPHARNGAGESPLDLWRVNPNSKHHPDLLKRMEKR